MAEEKKTADRELTLLLTERELQAIRALTQGMAALLERDLSESDAVVAAAEAGLVRLLEDFELPSEEIRGRVSSALEDLRGEWIRGNACL